MSEKSVLITQSNYIPWKGYFDMIAAADDFVLYDDMQFTKRDWRNRNRIKTAAGPIWLTVPVNVKGKFLQKINETAISDPSWAAQHWASIVHAYARAPFFKEYSALFAGIYSSGLGPLISQVNFIFIKAICELLGKSPRFHWSSDFNLAEDRNERLVQICRELGATSYITGPRARDYLDQSLFEQAGIAVNYFDFSGYPPYSQLHGDFIHEVSILDLLFNTGPEAKHYMKNF